MKKNFFILFLCVSFILIGFVSCNDGGGDGNYRWYFDADGDGYGDKNKLVEAKTQPEGYVSNHTDCDDSNANINSDSTEICGDSKDNNCNGKIDEECSDLSKWYLDADGDGYGNLNSFIQATSKPVGYVSTNTDCNDSNQNIHPGMSEICSDGFDNDCNGKIDEICAENKVWFFDADHDGYGDPAYSVKNSIQPVGYVSNNKDCNDNNANIYPGATEICGDEIDQNCDSQDLACTSTNNITMNDFVGTWKGYGTYVRVDETHSGNVTLNFSIINNKLSATFIYNSINDASDNGDNVKVEGFLNEGVFTCKWPNSDPNNPDCSKWDVNCTAKLNSSLKTMNFELNGIDCSYSAGKFNATLTLTSNPISMQFIITNNTKYQLVRIANYANDNTETIVTITCNPDTTVTSPVITSRYPDDYYFEWRFINNRGDYYLPKYFESEVKFNSDPLIYIKSLEDVFGPSYVSYNAASGLITIKVIIYYFENISYYSMIY
ncbi:MAG: putative metal-binding motif-containing protein [Desulfobacterales bacterium]|nr:putative metal-binding motif-containing protein [Desulfobacterales bacterium]